MFDVVVVGQIGRDLVLAVDHLPGGGKSVAVSRRREVLGGAVNQAVGARQLGCRVALVGVVGDDDAGRSMLDQARRDGLDTTGVARRPGGTTALFVDLVEADGTSHLLEHVPASMRLGIGDVHGAWSVLCAARVVLVQLAQPGPAVLKAIRIAVRHGARVVLDGTNEDPAVMRDAVAMAHVVRADAAEAADLVGRDLRSLQDVVTAAEEILTMGPSIVALAVAGTGNVVAWPAGHVVVPLLGEDPVDATGGGDAFVAALVVAMLRGHDAYTGAWWASAASALTVSRLGGRPALDLDHVTGLARSSRHYHERAADRES